MKEIALTQNKVALVDDEDFDHLNQFKWHVANNYAHRTICSQKRKHTISMHRTILNPKDDMEVDHIDGNGLNNQKLNLRIVTHRQNGQNLHIKKTSRYPGVHLMNVEKYKSKPWRAQIRIEGNLKNIGQFATEEEAFTAYKEALV
jgi:hypothetical protein